MDWRGRSSLRPGFYNRWQPLSSLLFHPFNNTDLQLLLNLHYIAVEPVVYDHTQPKRLKLIDCDRVMGYILVLLLRINSNTFLLHNSKICMTWLKLIPPDRGDASSKREAKGRESEPATAQAECVGKSVQTVEINGVVLQVSVFCFF